MRSKYRPGYSNRDPYWTSARFNSECSCGVHIRKGDKIFYYPSQRKAVCETCGNKGYSDLLREKSMDAYGTDCMYDA